MTPAEHMARGFRLYFVVRYWLRWAWHRLTCVCGVSWTAYRQENWPRYALGAFHLVEHSISQNARADPEKLKQALVDFGSALAKYDPCVLVIRRHLP